MYNVITYHIEPKQTVQKRDNFTIDECEAVVNHYISKSGIKLINDRTSSQAYYSPASDTVVVPMITQFENSKSYYGTLYHEMAHSTGHRSRLDRLSKTAHFGNAEYSREELTAEITSAILCSHTGIDCAELTDNNAAYINSWLKAIKGDTNMVLVAAAKAEKAVEYILN